MPEANVAVPAAQPTLQPGAAAPEVATIDSAVGGQVPGAAPTTEPQASQGASTTPTTEPQPQPAAEPAEPGGVQKRITELTRARREAERRAQEAEAQAAAAFEALQRLQPTAAAEPVAPLEPPVFETPEQFARDMAEYTQRVSERAGREAAVRARQESEQQALQRAQMAEQERVRTSFMAQVEKEREQLPDFDDVVNSPDVPISVPLAAAIAQHPQGAKVAYFLGSHADEAKRIVALPVALQVAELGAIAYKLAHPPAAATSKAPPPIDPVRGPSAATAPDVGEMSMDQYAAQRKGRR